MELLLLTMEFFQWSLFLVLTISTLLYVTTVASKKSTRNIRRPCLPPGPAPLPVVGNLFLLAHELHRSLANLAKVYGPIMTLKLGLTTTIVVSSPQIAKEALQTKDQQFAGRSVPDVANALGHADISVVFQSTTQLWKQLRGICTTNLFSNRCLDSGRRMREEKVRQMVECFRAQAGRPVDFGSVTFGTVLNVISNSLLSVDMADLNSESMQEIRELVSTITEDAAKPNISDFFPAVRFLDLQGRRRAYSALSDDFLSRIDELIDRRLRSKASFAAGISGDFLDHLLQLHAEDKLDRKIIRSLLGDLFVAGTDTTSITLVWAMAELQRNPWTLAKARAELQEVMGPQKDQVEEADVAKLPYLRAVIKEVLRLHPPVPLLIPHKATAEGAELGGYAVPKGAQLLVNAWAIGRDERVWPEAEAFKPERFLGISNDVDVKGRDFELIPFGSGRRACPGMALAMRTLQLALAALLHAFEWSLPEGMEPNDLDMTEKFGLTIAMVAPLRVVGTVASPTRRG